jgi:cellulose synthase/poly-beta-1,6-N-acetylglucosamine synthase-like glycosyltransferase
MGQIAAVGGFDKELELLLLKNRHRIAYANSAMVYDEKTSEKNVFVNQRRRWLSAQFVYLRRYFFSGFSEFFRHQNTDYLDKVVQMALPPRIINLGLVTFFSLLSWAFFLLGEQAPLSMAIFWTANLFALMVSFTLTIPGKYFWSNPVKIILALPSGFFSMLKALLKTRKANKNFIHTPHGAH